MYIRFVGGVAHNKFYFIKIETRYIRVPHQMFKKFDTYELSRFRTDYFTTFYEYCHKDLTDDEKLDSGDLTECPEFASNYKC